MAIVPRCYLTGNTGTATVSPALTGWTNSGAGAAGTAPQPGDYVLIQITDNTTVGASLSQTAGTPWTVLKGPTAQNTSGSFLSMVAGRPWLGTETAPAWTYTGATRLAWIAVAFAPDAGQAVFADTSGTEKIDSTASTSHTAPAATASAGATDTSVLLEAVSAGATGTTAITYTVPASWTLAGSVNNVGTSGQYVFGVWVGYRASQTGTVTPAAQTIQGGASGTGTTLAVLNHVLLREYLAPALPDRAAAAESVLVAQAAMPDQVAAAEVLAVQLNLFDTAAAEDDGPFALIYAESQVNAIPEGAGAADGLIVAKLPVPTPVPGLVARIASPAFILSRMPVMHVQNLITGQWLHRDVQGVTSPSITWQLNQPDSFTCTLGPPRPDLMTPAGEPLLSEWRDACYLEENGEIKFGGILTGSTFSGPLWQTTWSGFMGYPAGIPYEGPDYVKTRIDALDVVRDLWRWLQAQPNADIHMDLDATDSGTLLGADVPSGAKTSLNGNSPAGSTVLKVHDGTAFQPKMKVSIAGGAAHIVKSAASATITLTNGTALAHYDGATVAQVMPPTPIAIYWYNSTDIGQEIGNIQTEAVFDMWETHEWTSATRSGVRHRLHFGVPRAGKRQATLRFAEGENVVESVQGTRDGSGYANEVVGLGSGQGARQIRAQVAQVDGHLRRVLVYTDQTIKTTARMQSRAQRILASRIAIDTPTTVVIRNHPNAPFGSFVPGDDIYVQWVTGWRNTGIWGRITQMAQDPTTDLMTLTLARSDSFTYLAQAGQAGTL